MITIERYTASRLAQWDELVRRSRNGTMLHERGYMDYHSHRFDDCSLLALDGGRLLAALPANAEGSTLCSHRGLSYGGWLMPSRRVDAGVMLDVCRAMADWLRLNGFTRLVYKPVPHIYHRYPAEEDLYALWRCGAVVNEVCVSATIDLRDPLPLDRGNKSGLAAARRAGIEVGPSDEWAAYWTLLTEVLAERHAATPVHTLDEIVMLRDRMTGRIALYAAMLGGSMLAGTVVYFTPTVAHCQYIASGAEGRRLHALTTLFDCVHTAAAARGCRYLDFGISTEEHGHVLNRGLNEQKARLGGRATITQVLTLDL